MAKVYGYIYKITNIENSRVYIGQTKHSFEKRYGGLTINHVYKNSHNKELKKDIEKYKDERCWVIEPVFDIAYSEDELNEKENALFMRYIWDYMRKKKRKKRADLYIDELGNVIENGKPWTIYFDNWIPPVLYNQTTPTHKKSRDRAKRYIYTTDKMHVMFTSQVKMRNYVESNREPFDKNNFPYGPCFWGDGGYFYVPWNVKFRLKNKGRLNRVKSAERCIEHWGNNIERFLYSKNNEYKVLVKYTGVAWRIRKIYKPCRLVFIGRIEVIK